MRENFTIRTMTAGEVGNIAVEWASAEGWNPGLHDASCFYATDPGGFLLGLLDGQPIACISAIAYDETFGFIGFYIVKQEYRGKGYGLQLWKAAMSYLSTQNIGLDGVVEQQPNYKKSGFTLAYNNIRFETTTFQDQELLSGIVPLSEPMLKKVIRYDRAFFPTPRPAFLRHWLALPESNAFVAIIPSGIEGYALIRKCRSGYKIGPLFADTAACADQLFRACCGSVEPGARVYLDIPEVNREGLALAECYRMHKVFETARMYTKSVPAIDTSKIYGVTSFELG